MKWSNAPGLLEVGMFASKPITAHHPGTYSLIEVQDPDGVLTPEQRSRMRAFLIERLRNAMFDNTEAVRETVWKWVSATFTTVPEASVDISVVVPQRRWVYVTLRLSPKAKVSKMLAEAAKALKR